MLYLLSEAMHLVGTCALVFEGSLRNDTATIERRIDIVNRDAEDLHAILQRLLHSPGTAKSGQERRVNIDDTSCV